MALLTNTDLRKIISSNIEEADSFKLIIAPYDEGGLTPVGYDPGRSHLNCLSCGTERGHWASVQTEVPKTGS